MYPTPLVKAEMNYYGPNGPDTTKFQGNIDFHPFSWVPFNAKINLIQELPLSYELQSAFPNPFNPQTTISFSLAEPGYTTIEIYNILGQKISTLMDEYKQAGNNTIIWNGTNKAGEQVASGVYFYRLQSGDFTDSKKMLLLR